MNDVEILVTGFNIMKGKTRGTNPVVEELIRNADKEIQIVAYLFSSHALHILELIEDAAEKGVKVDIIINDLRSQHENVIAKLNQLVNNFPHLRVYNFEGNQKEMIHAKILVTDRKKAIVGSANFSWSGMYKNYEIGVFIEGETVWDLAKVVDEITKLSTSII